MRSSRAGCSLESWSLTLSVIFFILSFWISRTLPPQVLSRLGVDTPYLIPALGSCNVPFVSLHTACPHFILSPFLNKLSLNVQCTTYFLLRLIHTPMAIIVCLLHVSSQGHSLSLLDGGTAIVYSIKFILLQSFPHCPARGFSFLSH